MTKRLTLLRHAKSSWKDLSLSDFDRPLNQRGRRSAPEMGRRLLKAGKPPDLVISSPAKRAITTARMAATEMGFPEGRIIEEPALYHAGYRQILDVINSIESYAEHLLICGHNPGFTDLANTLSNARIDNLPTAGLFCVDFDIEDWRDLEAGAGTFRYFDKPRNDSGQPYMLEQDDQLS
jgi:phosphohistidine phosphatase